MEWHITMATACMDPGRRWHSVLLQLILPYLRGWKVNKEVAKGKLFREIKKCFFVLFRVLVVGVKLFQQKIISMLCHSTRVLPPSPWLGPQSLEACR